MPKKSGKSKSKRKTLKQKYKIIKKTKEHHRKKRKEERKAAASGKGKHKVIKDPGIPSQWPFKEELIKEFAWKKQQILLEEKAKRDERKRAREVSCFSCFVLESNESSLTRLDRSRARARLGRGAAFRRLAVHSRRQPPPAALSVRSPLPNTNPKTGRDGDGR